MEIDTHQLTMDIEFTGPYSWPKLDVERILPNVPTHPGIYLMTVDYIEGFLIYAAGITRRTIPKRLYEHTIKYMDGDYNVLETESMQQGIRKVVWHGWGWTSEKKATFEKRKAFILDAVHKQLACFRIFVADIGTEPRILERLEASIMNNLYQQPLPLCDIPDRGMMLAPRWDSEKPILVRTKCEANLYGLPRQIEI